MSDDPDYLFALQLQQQFDAAETSQPKKTKKSTVDSDFELALKLQNEMDDVTALNSSNELDAVYSLDMSNSKKTNENEKNNKMLSKPEHNQDDGGGGYLDQTANLVHPEWELVDPTPDVFAMFTRFDEKFFQRRLGAVVVEWSKRMYSCAGICYQRGNRYVKEIIIRLSEPLLKLRPRKDLVETLLHEMIHAYCFVLNIREGNGGHGPNFKRIMTTINKVAGTNITVYHSFHDEVNAYKTHIWRCNGVCQFHHPFQGWVKRTSNRAPGPNDQWWAKHQSECGGVFEKVQGPKPTPVPSKSSSNKVPKTQAKTESAVGNDIRNYLKKPTSGSGSSQPILKSTPAILATAGVATSAFPPTSYPGLSSNPMVASASATASSAAAGVGGKRSNVRGFKDLNSSDEESPQVVTPRTEMQGKGYSLGSGESTTGTASTDAAKRNMLRDHWSKRFPAAGASTQVEPNPSKRARINDSDWEAMDDEVWVRDEIKSTITISDSEDDDREQQPASTFKEPAGVSARNVKANANANISVLIKREIMEDETSFDDDEIMMIDDEFDDNDNSFTAATELADQSVIDDLFGEDTLLQEFQRENDVVPTGSRYHHDERNDITTCPICFDKMKRSEFTNHLDGCSITIKVKPPSFKGKSQLPVSIGPSNNNRNRKRVSKSRGKPRASSNKHQILKSSGYTSDEIAALNLSSSGESSSELTPRQRRQFNAPTTVVNLNSSGESGAELTPRQIRQRTLKSTNTQCPKCGRELANYLMEAHGKFCKG
ncbi:DNA-dependent metalloprotease SPRTN isoform X1 [Drosophila sulfurigaster albostrigata]|uniref:DNA-dependent metalloprotease SPRTN isoform X1 n=1 Tax=Drosophila sulfurigaster albostrigata TaxID=89887 RepID=UPI002D21B768|nr:DNA-dependent metalloprotease SPRTN isoform X1 [Drosophila sulfurigaster albostrigata]